MSGKKRGNPTNEVPWYEEATYVAAKAAAKSVATTGDTSDAIYSEVLHRMMEVGDKEFEAKKDAYVAMTRAAKEADYTHEEAKHIASLYVTEGLTRQVIENRIAWDFPRIPVDELLASWETVPEEEEGDIKDWILDKLSRITALFPSPGELLGETFAYAIAGLSRWIWEELAEALKPPIEEGG